MPINPAIALGVKPIQFESPVNMMTQAYQLQSAGQANQLNQMKMAEYQRARQEEEGVRNYLLNKDIAAPDTQSGLLQFGKTGLEYAKQLQAQQTAALAQRSAQLKFKTDMAEAAGRIYMGVKDQASWDAAKPRLAALGGDASALPATYDPNFIASELGQAQSVKDQWDMIKPKVEQIKTGDRIIFRDTNPRSPTFGQEMLPTEKEAMSPYERARVDQEQTRLDRERMGVVYQQDASGNIVALPSRLAPGEVPTARTAVAPVAAPVAGAPAAPAQPLQAKPSEAVQKERLSINQQRSQIQGALKAIDEAPGAFGFGRGLAGSTVIGESAAGRMDTEQERAARSYVYNIISSVIKERAGTAQSAQEMATMNRFLPGQYDNAEQIKSKLEGFDRYLKDREKGTTTRKETPSEFPGAPKIGTVQQGYRYKGGDPANQSSWEKQ